MTVFRAAPPGLDTTGITGNRNRDVFLTEGEVVESECGSSFFIAEGDSTRGPP